MNNDAVFKTSFTDENLNFDTSFSSGKEYFDSGLNNISYGVGSTTNYNNLANKPSINGIVLTGDKTSDDLNISPIITASTHFNFPNVGKENVLYIAKEENKTYRYDAEDSMYYVVGSDYMDINMIDGGNAYV